MYNAYQYTTLITGSKALCISYLYTNTRGLIPLEMVIMVKP